MKTAWAALLLLAAPVARASAAPEPGEAPPCCCHEPGAVLAPLPGAEAPHPPRGAKRALLGAGLGAAAGLGLGYAADPARPPGLRGRPLVDTLAFAAGVGGVVLPKRLEGGDGPAGPGRWRDCRCPTAAPGSFASCEDALNGFDRAIRKAFVAGDLERRQRWSDLSDLTLAASLASPLALIVAAERGTGERGRALLVFAEAEAVAMGLNGIAKHVFHRPRPYAHFGEPPDPGALAKDDSRLSFFSGHATASFAAAVSAGRVADLRGYRHRGWIWGGGVGMALATGVARLASDRHYATDVLVGMAVGTASGWAIPKLHERRLRPGRPAAVAAPALAGPFASPGPALSFSAPVLGRRASLGLGPWADGVGAVLRVGW